MALRPSGFIAVPPGRAPGFDHADVYRAGGRVYVAHTGADRVDVIDARGRRYLRALPDLPGVAGVLIDQEHDLLFTSDRDCARVSVFRCSDERLLGRVAVGPRPNGLAYDPGRRRLVVFNIGDPPGAHPTASVVEVDALRVVATVALPGRPRWAIYDRGSDRVYANVQAPAQIVVLDPEEPRIERALDVPAAGPHGLAVSGELLLCAADGASLVALRRTTGALVGQVPLEGAPDVVWHDPATDRIYVAIGEPGVVQVVDAGRFRTEEVVRTEAGAHTTAWDADRRALYVFCPASRGAAVYAER